jgi:pyruvate-formate lyase-activating enzyme
MDSAAHEQREPAMAEEIIEVTIRPDGKVEMRYVIWTQGCSLGCPGCFNPETHPHLPAQRAALPGLRRR